MIMVITSLVLSVDSRWRWRLPSLRRRARAGGSKTRQNSSQSKNNRRMSMVNSFPGLRLCRADFTPRFSNQKRVHRIAKFGFISFSFFYFYVELTLIYRHVNPVSRRDTLFEGWDV